MHVRSISIDWVLVIIARLMKAMLEWIQNSINYYNRFSGNTIVIIMFVPQLQLEQECVFPPLNSQLQDT